MEQFFRRTIIAAVDALFPQWADRMREEVTREIAYRRIAAKIEGEATRGSLSGRIDDVYS